MRKFVIVFVLIFLTIFSFGQMIFNNIPLGGLYFNFKLELQKKGFTYHSDNVKEAENIFSYTGKFISKDADLRVLITPTSKIVWKVNVELPELTSWVDIKSEFLDLRDNLVKKYGPRYTGYATFSKPYSEGDGNELLAIYQNKCSYDFTWKTENGLIVIKIISHREGTALIDISYEDQKASTINDEEKEKIIFDGL